MQVGQVEGRPGRRATPRAPPGAARARAWAARSNEASRAGAVAGDRRRAPARRAGRSSAQRAPSAAISRRWIADRALELDQLLGDRGHAASPTGSAGGGRAAPAGARTRAPDHAGRRRKRVVERRAGRRRRRSRSASARDARGRRGRSRGARRAANSTRSGARLRRCRPARASPVDPQPSRCASAAPRRRVSPSHRRRRPSRNGHGGDGPRRAASTRRAPTSAPPTRPLSRGGCRWTSTRNEFDAHDLAERRLARTARLRRARGRGGGAPRRPSPRPATKPVRRQRGGLARRQASGGAGSIAAGPPTTGRPSTTSRLLSVPRRLAHGLDSMTSLPGRLRLAVSRAGRGTVRNTTIPVRRADPEAALVVLEVVAHVQLAQPPPEPRTRRVVVQRVVDHVVDQVARQEPAGDGAARCSAPSDQEERPRPRSPPAGCWPTAASRAAAGRSGGRGGRRGSSSAAARRALLGLEVEDHAVQPVLGERPHAVAAEHVARATCTKPARSTPVARRGSAMTGEVSTGTDGDGRG